MLTTNEEKRHMFEHLGIDYVVECPFTQEIMCMEPEDFIAKIVRQLHVKCMVVGEDFHFGHNRRGDYHMLRQYAGKYGYEVIVVEKIKEDSRDISSTFVREEIAAGEYREGKSSSGIPLLCDQQSPARQPDRKNDRDSDHQPAAAEGELLPPNGVYVTEAYIGDRWYRGISNVGCKPTIEGEYPVGGGDTSAGFRGRCLR